MKIMKPKISFTLSKIDEINLKKFDIVLKDYKIELTEIFNYMVQLKELKNNIIDNKDISKIRFDIGFCTDNTIKDINREYRKKDSITDVITFSLFCDDENSIIYRKTADLGQIIVSIETAQRQKKSTLKDEILTLIIHGFLHLIGFDHLNKKDYDFVVRVQEKILNNYHRGLTKGKI